MSDMGKAGDDPIPFFSALTLTLALSTSYSNPYSYSLRPVGGDRNIGFAPV